MFRDFTLLQAYKELFFVYWHYTYLEDIFIYRQFCVAGVKALLK